METLQNRMAQLNERFLRNNIKVDNDWLSGCTEWFLSENPNISITDLYNQANEQWLLSDLTEIGISCLPQSVLENTGIVTLNGNYALQLKYLIDISESCYDQYRTIHNKKLDEANEEQQLNNNSYRQTKKKRVLKLELTDGHKDVISMEYSPIPCLNTKLSPGCKIMLIGPMRCVNKVIFLESKNVKVLGGEVDKFQVENAYENVLNRALGKPINQNPIIDYEETSVLEETFRPPNITNTRPFTANVRRQSQNKTIEKSWEKSNVYEIPDDMFEDDDLLSSVNIDATVHANNPINVAEVDSTINLLDDDDDVLMLAEDVAPTAEIVRDDVNQMDQMDINDFEQELRMHEEQIEMNEESFDALELQNIVQVIRKDVPKSICDSNYEFKIRGIALVTIEQLNLCDKSRLTDKCFMLKSEISDVFSKVQVKNGEWRIGVRLKDCSNSTLQVNISNDILTTLATITASELLKLRLRLADQPQIKDEILQILENLQQSLSDLNCFMKVKYLDEPHHPVIVELINEAPVLNKILAAKLEKEKNSIL